MEMMRSPQLLKPQLTSSHPFERALTSDSMSKPSASVLFPESLGYPSLNERSSFISTSSGIVPRQLSSTLSKRRIDNSITDIAQLFPISAIKAPEGFLPAAAVQRKLGYAGVVAAKPAPASKNLEDYQGLIDKRPYHRFSMVQEKGLERKSSMQGNLSTFDLNTLLEDPSFHSKTAYGWDYHQALASQRKSNAIAPSKIPELSQAQQ